MGRWRRVAAAVALTAAMGAIPSSVASAQLVDCTGDPPPLQSPSYTTAAIFDDGPTDPRPGDPFADEPTTTIYEQYEWAGLQYGTYDLGCGVDITASPDAVIGTYISNMAVFGTELWGGMSAGLHRVVADPPSIFDPVDSQIEQVTDALSDPAVMFMGIAFLALGGFVLWKSRSAAYHEVAKMVGFGFLFLTVGLFVMGAPLRIAQAFDGVLSDGIAWVRTEIATGTSGSDLPDDPSVGISGSKHTNIAYPAWVDGTFGNGATECADRFAADIFQAGTLTTEEEARAENDPDYREELFAEKNVAFKATAAEVKEFNEECYMHMIGQRPMPRVGSAFVGAASMTVTSLFDIVAGLMILAGYLSVRLFVMFALPIAVVSILRPSLMIGVAAKVFGTVLNALLFGIAVGIFAIGQQVLFASSLPSWLALLVVILSAWMFWKATASIRRTDPTGKAAEARGRIERMARTAAREGWRYWSTRQAVEHGNEDADRDREYQGWHDTDTGEPADVETETTGRREYAPATPAAVAAASTAGELTAASQREMPGTYVAGELPAGSEGDTVDVEDEGEVEAEFVDDDDGPVYTGEPDDDTTYTVERVDR